MKIQYRVAVTVHPLKSPWAVGEVEAEGGGKEDVLGVAGLDVALEVAVAEVELDEEVVAEVVAEDGFGNEEVGGHSLSYSIIELLLCSAVVEVDVAAPVGIAAVSAIAGADEVQCGMKFWEGLGLDAQQDFVQVGAHGMCQRLVVVAVAVHGPQVVLVGIVGVGIGSYAVVFQLQIEVGNASHIDVVHAGLPAKFVGAVTVAGSKIAEAPFVYSQLSVNLDVFERQPAEVETDQHFVGVAQLMLYGAVKDDGVQVIYIKATSVFVVVVKGNGFKETDVQLVGNIQT